MVVGELADPDEALFTRHDLDERPEIDGAGNTAGVDLTDPRLLGETFDYRDRLAGVFFAGRADEDRSIVLDVDGALGFFDDRPDHLAAWTDNDADLLARDLDAIHPGCVARKLGARFRD